MAGSPFDRMLRGCIKCFKIDAEYVRDGNETPVKGVFDNDYQTVELEDGPPVTSRTITFGIHEHDLPFTPAKGDKIRIKGQLYRIVEPQHDSEYGITLILKKA